MATILTTPSSLHPFSTEQAQHFTKTAGFVSGDPAGGAYWFKMPDDLAPLLQLKDAELKAYLLVQRSIQKDRHSGEISARWLAARLHISAGNACQVLQRLCGRGLLHPSKHHGQTTVYDSPISWRQAAERPASVPPRRAEFSTECSPMRERWCSPMRERHIESLENRLPSSSSLVAPVAATPVSDDDDTPKKPSQDEGLLAQPKTETPAEKIEPAAVIAIANDLNVTESVATQIVASCRRAAPDATAEEILEVAKAEAVRIAERTTHGLRVVNSIGLLITSVPQRLEGGGLSRLRAARAARDLERERSEERERRRKQQELDEARAILADPNAHEIRRECAALVIRLAAGRAA